MWQLVIWVALMALSYAMAPKPQKPKAAGLDDMNVPTASASAPIVVLFGRRKIAPNCVWYGDMKTKSVKTKGK